MVMINDQQGFRNIAELMTNPQCPACGEKLDFKQEDAATGQLLPTFKAQHHDKDFNVDLNTMPVIVSVTPTPVSKPAATTAESKKKPSNELAEQQDETGSETGSEENPQHSTRSKRK